MSPPGGSSSNPDGGDVALAFPSWALQPKKETGAGGFVNRFPEYDGRGTILAILDSGVDPGAGGLSVTSDGKRKLIDRIDATGNGDIDTSKVAELKDGKLEGTTGRTLTLPEDCLNSKEYRVGSLRAYCLYPLGIKNRIVGEKQKTEWEPARNEANSAALNDLNKLTADKKADEWIGLEKLRKEDAESKLEALSSLDKRFKEKGGDPGPTYDVVVCVDVDDKNQRSYKVLIDNSETGDMKTSTPLKLRPFRETGDFAALTAKDRLNVSVNVYENGDVTQIVGLCSNHGTHVASIAAACFPDEPERNGVAPGAQVISITIGDGRLGSMETGTGLARAISHIMRAEHYKVDVINMSYGEYSHWSNSGRIGDLIGEVINKHGVMWCASAGNNGPALFTLGTPPDIGTNTILGIGAYVSNEMMVAQYSMQEKTQSTPYTWSSRGPSIDGDRGVTICAPGGAITSVAKCAMTGQQLMNGTSMASPHTCGALGLVLSGLKARNVGYSPFSVKRALENSAAYLPERDLYAQGHGLLRIEETFNHCVSYAAEPERDVRFAVKVDGTSKGLHIRGRSAFKKADHSIGVTPKFLNDEEVSPDLKVDFAMDFAFSCSADWIKIPDYLKLAYQPRDFAITVDPTGLDFGVHTAFVKAYDTKKPLKGHLFEIPVTVVKAEPLIEDPSPKLVRPKIQIGPKNPIVRHFVQVPDFATWAELKVRSLCERRGKFFLHTVELIPKRFVRELEEKKYFDLGEFAEFGHNFPVKGGHVLEVCLAKSWRDSSALEISLEVDFRGLTVEPGRKLAFHGAAGVERFEVASHLRREEVYPEIELKSLVNNYRPSEAKISACGDRDVVPPKRVTYELQLSYNFSVPKATEVTPDLPWFSDVLYESEFESQLCLLFNSHKQLVNCSDANPKDWTVKLEKDDYVLKAQVRHEKQELLEKLKETPLSVSFKLASSIGLDVYKSFAAATTGGKTSSSFNLPKGSTAVLYAVTNLNGQEKHLKGNLTQGSVLEGALTLTKDDASKRANVYPVRYIVNDNSTKKSGSGGGGEGKKAKDDKKQDNLVNEALIGCLGKFDKTSGEQREKAKKLFDEIHEKTEEGSVQRLNCVAARLNFLDIEKLPIFNKDKLVTDEEKKTAEEKATEAFALAEKAAASIDIKEIVAMLAFKHDSRPDAAELKKDYEKKRDLYFEFLSKKIIAGCYADKNVDEDILELMKFVNLTEAKVLEAASVHAEKSGHFGRALKYALNQSANKAGVKEVEEKIIRLMKKLGWQTLAEIEAKNLTTKYPSGYETF